MLISTSLCEILNLTRLTSQVLGRKVGNKKGVEKQSLNSQILNINCVAITAKQMIRNQKKKKKKKNPALHTVISIVPKGHSVHFLER
jgi:hypothetical protein